jgi:hypothetical protein
MIFGGFLIYNSQTSYATCGTSKWYLSEDVQARKYAMVGKLLS